MSMPLIDKMLPKITEAQAELDIMLNGDGDKKKGLDPMKIDDIMKYNAMQMQVSGAVGFLSKGLSAKQADLNKANQ